MLDLVDAILAWLCRQAGVHRSNYTLIKKGERNLTENMKNKFSKVLGINKDILFKDQ